MTMIRKIRGSALIVTVTGMMLGVFVWKTWFGYVPHLYPVEFEQGQWIQTPEGSPQAYFRYEFSISEPVRHAWLKTGSTDVMILYVNGTVVGDKSDMSLSGEQTVVQTYISNIYDITPYLHPGKNVIGVEARKILHGGTAQALIEGAYLDREGRTHPFFSDGSWKASSVKETQRNGDIAERVSNPLYISLKETQRNGETEWYEEEFRSDSWGYAKVSGLSAQNDSLYTKIHPDVFVLPLKGKQIGDHNIRTGSVMFFHSFEIRDRLQGAWMRIAAGSRYDIAVNDVPVAHHDGSEKKVDIYDIRPVLRKGINTVRVSVTDQESMSPVLAADCVGGVRGKASPLTPDPSPRTPFLFATDASWQTLPVGWVKPTFAVCLSDTVSLPFPKKLSMLTLPLVYELEQTLRASICIFAILSITISLWYLSAFLLCRIRNTVSMYEALRTDAIFHLPAAVFLGAVYLLQYDIRLNISFPFQEKWIYGAIGILLLFRITALTGLRGQRSEVRGIILPLTPNPSPRTPYLLAAVCLTLIIASGLSLRLSTCINTPSLSHDEISMAIFAQSVLKSGYPFKSVGPIRKLLTTYELLPYPIALSVAILGHNDAAVRMPAIIFGTLTALLIAYISFRSWGLLSSILSAGIYAFSPFSILWGSNAFHPQQTQFFVLMTAYLFYQAIHSGSEPVRPGYFYAATLCFIISYLSWEGSGMILAGLFACLLVTKGRNLSWLKSGPLWAGLIAAGLAVFVQLIRRNLSNVMYIMVGAGLTGKIFQLAFLSPLYSPWFYVQNFLFDGNHILLTLFTVCGLPFIFANTEARYFFIILFVLLMLLTNLFPEVSTRYVYFVQPFLILPASAVIVRFLEYIRKIPAQGFRGTETARIIFCLMFPAAIFLSANMQCLQLLRLGNHNLSVSNEIFPFPDYRSAAFFIKDRLLPDDAVISLMPHTFEYYTGRQCKGTPPACPYYYLQENSLRQIVYDVSESSHGYLDKYVGTQVIRNLDELQDVLNRHRRVWIEAVAYYPFVRLNSGPTLEYLFKNTKLVFETYNGKVYLWER